MSWQCLSSGYRKARAIHRCFFCNEYINIGDRYHFRAGASEGRIHTMKIHPECDEATKNWDSMDYETFSEGEMTRPTQIIQLSQSPAGKSF